MKNYLKNSIVIIITFLSYSCFGYCYEIFVDSKTNKSTQKRQLVIAFADYHLKSHPANKKQRAYIESLLQRCAATKGKLIVEDLSSANNDGKMICCRFGVNCSEGVLGQLADKARSWGIEVDNVEYRYCRVASIGPLLNNLEKDPCSIKSTSAINMVALYEEVMDEIKKIKKYDDGKFLNNLYKHAIAKVEAALLKMGFNNDMTVADYCKSLSCKQYRQELEKLCIFDSALIDMHIMHAIALCPDDSFIFIIAGGSHVEQVNTFLRRMGYTSLLKKVSHSTIKMRANIHPQPVDITIINKFIY